MSFNEAMENIELENDSCDIIASKISPELDDPDQQTAIFELLGKAFVLKYFPYHNFEPVKLRPDKKEAIEAKATAILDGIVVEASVDMEDSPKENRSKLYSIIKGGVSEGYNSATNHEGRSLILR